MFIKEKVLLSKNKTTSNRNFVNHLLLILHLGNSATIIEVSSVVTMLDSCADDGTIETL